jgi:hypothetical protein
MTEKNPWVNKMWTEIFEEMTSKGDALLDLYNSVCIVRLRQVVKWSLEEMWRIKDHEEITDVMWEDYAELSADVLAAKRLLEYFGASTIGEKKMAKWDLSKLEKVANEEARHGNREALEVMTNKYDSLMGLIDNILQDLDDGVPACDAANMIRHTLAKLDSV